MAPPSNSFRLVPITLLFVGIVQLNTIKVDAQDQRGGPQAIPPQETRLSITTPVVPLEPTEETSSQPWNLQLQFYVVIALVLILLGAVGAVFMYLGLTRIDNRFRESFTRLQKTIRELEARVSNSENERNRSTSNMIRQNEDLSMRIGKALSEENGLPALWRRIYYIEDRTNNLLVHKDYQHVSEQIPVQGPTLQGSKADYTLAPFASTPPVLPDPDLDDVIGALNRSDKALLRTLAKAELNITTVSEESLQKGKVGIPTELCTVDGGGSYLLIERGDRYWLIPTVQTLAGFSLNQPQKGIFEYERDSVTEAELARAAEIQLTADTWQILCKGLVLAPQ